MPLPATRLSAVPAVVLVAVAIWELFATRCQATAVPGDDEWARAAEIVRGQYRRGDLIVFAPPWADPIGRLHLGDLIPLEHAGRMDVARYGRIWELAIRGAIAPDLEGIEPPVERFAGPVEVRRYERKPVEVVGDLLDAPNAKVDLVEVAFEPHRCVVLVVPPMGTKLVYKNMPLGSELVGYVGIADVFTRREERTPVRLEVEVDGARKTEVIAPIDTWVQFHAKTKPGNADVAFTVWWDGQGKSASATKRVCLAAEARR